ncbi:MAG: hypothetical protein H6977_12995 [Gammaproteobacteria bacterium]|nr:hypothetical protein [Gammaproteobacteria bacterium]
MPESSRGRVLHQLLPRGLARTLVVVCGEEACTVGRLRREGSGQVRLDPLGRFAPQPLPVIGRIGLPDPQLGDGWADGLPFYGKWFDDIGETDVGYHLRRNISALSRERLLEQIRRDEQYALVGDYAAVFATILEVKQRVPLVLLDDRYLELVSFPVVLPTLAEEGLGTKLAGILRIMLKAVSRNEDLAATTLTGIEVDEGE